MRMAVYVLIAIIALLVTMAYACCVVAGEADEREMRRREQEERERDEQIHKS